MRIAVIGVGGVGGYFGGRLALAGEDVTFIARGKNLEALQKHGLRVESIAGDFAISQVKASNDAAAIGPVDVVLVAVKAWQVRDAARSILPLVGQGTLVVPLQNGVEAPAQLCEIISGERIAGGLCRIICYVAEPGVIKHIGAVPDVAFGELNLETSERTERLLRVFLTAGIRAKIPQNIHTAMWEKFLFIASISGVGAVTRSAAGVIRKIPETRRMLQEAMKEIFAVASARGIPMPENSVETNMSYVDSLPASGTASMQRDILDGKPSELNAQNGAVVRLGKEVKVATPVHEFIYSCLIPLELKARGEIELPA